MAIDPDLGDAHCAQAYARVTFEFDWVQAERGYRRALELSPNSADACDLYGRLCAGLERFDEAVALHRRAFELDPLTHRSDLATTLIRAGRNDEAMRVAETAIRADPRDPRLRATLGWALFRQAREEEGLAELERAVALTPSETSWLAQLGQAYALAGRTEQACEVLRRLEDPSRAAATSPYHLAYVYTGLGNLDRHGTTYQALMRCTAQARLCSRTMRPIMKWNLLPARILVGGGIALAGIALVLVVESRAQGQNPPGTLQERFRQQTVAAEAKGLAEPFTGITAKGSVEPGMFALRSTGVPTEPVRKAAAAFLDALTADQRQRTAYALEDPEWRKWMNQHFYRRQGVSFAEMSGAQREKAFALLAAGLSAKGLTLTRDIMRLNHTLAELNNNDFEQYGEWLYYITVMGQPSATEPWGWQLDGHHAIINYFVLGDQVVMTPLFVGSEPVIAHSGKYKGTTILQHEQAQGLSFVGSLDAAQRQQAVLRSTKTGNDNLTEAWRDNVVLDYAGIRATDLTPVQRDQLMALVALYVNNQAEGHARVRLDDVRKQLDRTWFAWVGGTEPSSVFYYRVHSPVLLIEFDHQRPANLRHLAADPSVPNREHVHAVMRTPNGNDYGKDLLRQHYQQHPHSAVEP